MTYGLWLSAGGLQVNQYRQEILTNNMANVDTVGFKRDLAVIHERQVEAATSGGAAYSNRLLDRLGGGNWVRPTYTDFEQGGLLHTGADLDAAIEGKGFFTVRDGNELRYTRDGRFTLSPKGQLVLATGNGSTQVLDDAGRPIQIDAKGEKITISADGTIRQGRTPVAKLGVAEFSDPQQLRKVGKNLFRATEGRPQAPQDSSVRGGFVEDSAQNATTGLVDIIEVTRAHELNARMITLQDQTIGQAVNTVGRPK
jgi:flagellar basal-body rod protein FlgF